MNKKISRATTVLACLLGAGLGQEMFLTDLEQVTDDPLAWKNTSKSAEERATLLVNAMNFTEKAKMLSRWDPNAGENVWYDWTGATFHCPRLKVPWVQYNDGPQGFRDNTNIGSTTAWPSVLAFGQSWDKELLKTWGSKMAQEFKDKGAGVLLGPGMNVMRIPSNGRDFEYVSGEDPVVGAELVVPLVEGIQSTGVMANAKHFVNNNQETNRLWQSANIDERTQMEMYYPPFVAAIKADIGSVMCSYNKVNSFYSCANNKTLNYHLRDLFGFEGFVMSDWGAIHGRPKEYVSAGCDQEQGSVKFYNLTAIKEDLSEEQLDKTVHRIAKTFIKFGLYDHPFPDNYNSNVTSKDHQDFALKGAEKTTILLKNERETLPLKKEGGKWLLVLGNATAYPVTSGGGSGIVHTTYVDPPLWTLCDELGISRSLIKRDAEVAHACNEDYSNCISYVGKMDTILPHTQVHEDLDEETQVNIRSIQQMRFDATLIFAGVQSGEGADRTNLTWNAEVLNHLKHYKHKGKIIGCITAPGPIILNNLDKVADAIVFNVMPGQQYAPALMNILFGRVSPSAKLTFTMPNKENEMQMTEEQYPGLDDGINTFYTEQHHFGYRWYDQNMVKPAFEFGFGLSYSKFQYKGLAIDQEKRTVTFTIRNHGPMKASEIAQIYVQVPKTENFKDGFRSPKQLRAFVKFNDIEPHKEMIAKATEIPETAFQYWSVKEQKWVTEPGTYKIMVGASSRDIRLSSVIEIK